MVVLIILVTSLVTVLLIIITSATYLITLIVDESDDVGPDGLALDLQDFSATPVESPLDTSRTNQMGSKSVALDAPVPASTDKQSRPEDPGGVRDPPGDPQTQQVGPPDSGPDTSARQDPVQPDVAASESLQSFTSIPSDPGTVDSVKSNEIIGSETSGSNQEDTRNGASSWQSPAGAQKNLIISHLGPNSSKLLFDDFDTKEMQLGGTGLHWCKSRRSLDKLMKLGVPLEILNKREETALHVAIRRHKLQVLIGLLNYGADVERRNINGETPLILACKVNDIFACQLLLIYDADCDQTDDLGYSARHYAASICEKHKSQSVLPSAAHLILAMLNEFGAERCRMEPKGCEFDEAAPKGAQRRCNDGCAAGGTYNGNSYNRWPDHSSESLYKRHLFADIIESKLDGSKYPNAATSSRQSLEAEGVAKQSRLLCIDGGGLRGVIVCQIMLEMEKYLKRPMLSYFDWIGGTSVGAFLACALSLGTPLRELRRICFDVKDEVFSGNKPYNSKFIERVLKRTFGQTRMSDIRGKKLAVTTVMADREPCQLRFFRNYKSPSTILECHGFAADKFNFMSAQSVVTNRIGGPKKKSSTDLKSTQSKQQQDRQQTPKSESSSGSDRDDSSNDILSENEQNPLIWQAVRASAAAPFFFKPYGPYLDGGIISNNPTLDMLSEFHAYQKVRSFIRKRLLDIDNNALGIGQNLDWTSEPTEELDLVVSLGTGRGKVIGRQAMVDFGQVASGFATVFSPRELVRSIRAARDLFKKLMQQSCHTEDHILDRAQAWCSAIQVPYFRINPPLATIFSIDDKRDEQLVNALWQTKLYMRSMRKQLNELSSLLDEGPDKL